MEEHENGNGRKARGGTYPVVTTKRFHNVRDAVAAELAHVSELSAAAKGSLLDRVMLAVQLQLNFDPERQLASSRERSARQREREREKAQITGLSINAIRDKRKQERQRAHDDVQAARANPFKN